MGTEVKFVWLQNVKDNKQAIGVALSGGGSRAIAFHLGTFRALNELGVLEKVNVISAVSGGAVFAGMYGFSEGSFEEFEKDVKTVLRNGLEGALWKNLVASNITVPILISSLWGFCGRLLKGSSDPVPPKRMYSRTDALEKALDELFNGKLLTDERRSQNLHLVLNATDMNTGTAMRFGTLESGNWRLGKIAKNDIKLATAVASSAAFPLFLPALDRSFSFLKDGTESKRRTILTDGGVYDNLGTTCFNPKRSKEISVNVFPISCLICSEAGAGEIERQSNPFGSVGRMRQVYGITHKKSQDFSRTQVFEWKDSKALEKLVVTYLGQKDDVLPFKIDEPIRREDIAHYPTDFKSMKEEDIDKLSRRAEQLTMGLVRHYHPELEQ